MKARSIYFALATLLLPLAALAADAPEPTTNPTANPTVSRGPKPTLADVSYGTHRQQVLDFYKAKSEAPTPLVLWIHGGGWINGTKASIRDVADCLKAGISVVSLEYSPYELVTADDPPIYLSYPTPPALGQDQKDPTHTANFGVKLQEKCRSVGVPCELSYPGAPDVKHASVSAYLIDVLKGEIPKK